MQIIDVHTHAFPEAKQKVSIVERAMQKLQEEKLGLPEEITEKIFYLNAKKLLDIR
jgi:predicted TIM-barrel fold metal-dependent hydrolase